LGAGAVITFQELATFSSSRDWTLSGPNAVVKVVSIEDADRPARNKSAKGYITQAKYLKGLNALQIESALGLRPNNLKRGCYVFYFARLPEMGEVEQRFMADMPDGKVWDADMHRDYLAARDARDASGSDVVHFYPPGSARVKQWALTKEVPLSGLSKLVTPSAPFEV
jgi:hypothetical protein